MRVATMTIILFTALAAHAQQSDDAYQAAATHIVIANECQKTTGDTASLQRAIDKGRERLRSSGYDEAKAEASIELIVSHLRDAPEKPIPKEICADMLEALE